MALKWLERMTNGVAPLEQPSWTRSSTTTVVMKEPETWNESVVEAHVAGNGFDGPRTVSFGERSTMPGAAQTNAQVKAEQSPTSGVLPVPSDLQAHLFLGFFFRYL